MISSEREAPRFTRRLAVRLVAMLTLALLPLGLISIVQTRDLTASLVESAQQSRLAMTEQAALGERRVIYTALGAASALGAVLPDLRDDPEECSEYLANLVRESGQFAAVTYVPLSGRVTCASRPTDMDLSGSEAFRSQLETPRIRVESVSRGRISEREVVVISRPIFHEGALEGFVAVSVPYEAVANASDGTTAENPIGMILFNADGEVVTRASSLSDLGPELPANADLGRFADLGAKAVDVQSAGGEIRTYTVVPLIPGVVYAMAIWLPAHSAGSAFLTPIAFPLAMWVTSLLVGYLAIHRFVIVNIRNLSRDMRNFAQNRTLDMADPSPHLSWELREMQMDFLAMAESLLRDEAALQDALREKNELLAQKNVLMKEVHHRVKNNLQLISSIMNMQIRKSSSPETRRVLERLQERVLGLATVHRNLYNSDGSGAINAGLLVSELARQILVDDERKSVGASIRSDDVILFPDQAVPLSLLTAEALTNALKYSQAMEIGNGARIDVTLRKTAEDEAELLIVNSLGADDLPSQSDGLGTRLIVAFARQIGGELETEKTDDDYRLKLSFGIEDFQPA